MPPTPLMSGSARDAVRNGSVVSHADSRTDAQLAHILRLLTDNATVVVSGRKMADEIGTTRSAVWRSVEQLREYGVEIAGHPASGYRLQKIPDLLLPSVLQPLIAGTIFSRSIVHYFRIASASTAAMAAAAEGEPEGTVFVAEEQTGGRGRGGHKWESAPNVGIYFSVILRPEMPPADALLLSLAAGLAVVEAI